MKFYNNTFCRILFSSLKVMGLSLIIAFVVFMQIPANSTPAVINKYIQQPINELFGNYRLNQYENDENKIVLNEIEDERTGLEVLIDVKEALLNDEQLLNLFELNNKMTYVEANEAITRIIKIISETGNTLTNTYQIYENNSEVNLSTFTKAFYTVNQINDSVILDKYTNSIGINKSVFKYINAQNIFAFAIHEMIHAVQYENLFVNNQVSSFDKEILKQKYNGQDESRYASAPVEFMAYLISDSIVGQFYELAGFASYINIAKLPFAESYYKMYGANITDTLIYEETTKTKLDVNNYKDLNTLQLFEANYIKFLNDNKIDYNNVNLQETLLYKSFIEFMPEESLNVRYADYEDNAFRYEFGVVTLDINYFNVIVNSFINLGKQKFAEDRMGLYVKYAVCALTYNNENYVREDKELLIEFITVNISNLDDEVIAHHGLKATLQHLNSLFNELV